MKFKIYLKDINSIESKLRNLEVHHTQLTALNHK